LLTGYTTTLSGESEISAWEIASGCKKYWAAFLIDTSGVMLGILINFFDTLKAFARGRRTKNLYDDSISTKEALDMKIEDLRKKFLLDKYSKDAIPNLFDFLLFSLFAVFGLVYSILALPLLPFVIIYSIYIELTTFKKKRVKI
jgi:hypothetical protein